MSALVREGEANSPAPGYGDSNPVSTAVVTQTSCQVVHRTASERHSANSWFITRSRIAIIGLCNLKIRKKTTNSADTVLADTVSPIPVAQPGLTAFEESSNIVQNQNATPASIERQISQPFSITVPKELLERNYLIANTSWTNVSTTFVYSFPKVFSGITTITDTMKRFKYWRAKIHVEVRLQSTPYHQGSLITGWLPNVVPGALDTTVGQVSAFCDATVLDASTQDSVSFDIPYCHPLDWLYWDSANLATDTQHSTLVIAVLNVLKSSNTSISAVVPLLVYASLRDVEVSAMASQMADGNKFKKNNEAQKKQDQGFDTKGAITTVSKIARSLPVVGSAWGSIADTINVFAGDLNRPTSTTVSTPIAALYYNDFTHASGLTQAAQASLYPNAYLKQAPKMFGMETSHMLVSTLAKRPILFAQETFNAVTTSWSTEAWLRTSPAAQYDWLTIIQQSFRFYRGGLKFLFHFSIPAFYSFRVRFSLYYGSAPTDFGDVTTRIVDIKGSTWEEIYIPFLHQATWIDSKIAPVAALTPKLQVDLITSIVGSSSPAAPVVYMNVFRAAAEDYEVSGYRARTDEDMMNSQMHLGNKFQSPFRPINSGETQSQEKGLVMPEVAGTFSDLVKKPGRHGSYSEFFPSSGTWLISPFHFFSQFFMYWRGGRIIRHVHCETVGGTNVGGMFLASGTYTQHPFENGWAHATSSAQPAWMQEALHVPYFSAQPYYPVYPLASGKLVNSCYQNPPLDGLINLGAPEYTALSGADDFVLLLPIPWILLIPPSARKNREKPVVKRIT